MRTTDRNVILRKERLAPDFLQTELEKDKRLPLPANIHPNKVRANIWRVVDFDGDGALDVIAGIGDWTEYGWDNAYTANR